MSSDEQMTIDERRKYLRTMQKRYRQADRRGKGQLLDDMAAVTQLHRKSLVRLAPLVGQAGGPLTRVRPSHL